MAQSPKVLNNIKHEAAFAAKHAKLRPTPTRDPVDVAAEVAQKAEHQAINDRHLAKAEAKFKHATRVTERGAKVKSWLKGLKFGGGIGAMDNPLLSKEAMDKAQDAAGDAMEGSAIKKARVRPLRKGGMSA